MPAVAENRAYTIRLSRGGYGTVNCIETNKSRAIRVPKPVAFPDGVKKVDIVKLGRARLITQAGESWDVWFDGKGVSDDFFPAREQPDHQERELR